MKKEDIVKKKTVRTKRNVRKKVTKKESKLFQVYLFVKKKLADLVTMIMLLLPAAAEFLNLHKELIRTEYGTLYYIVIGIIYTYYHNKKKQEESEKEVGTQADKDNSGESDASKNEDAQNDSESVIEHKNEDWKQLKWVNTLI